MMRRSAAEHVDFDALPVRIAEQKFLRGRTLAAQAAALADGKLLAEFRFGQPGQREIEIVAAEQQMLADRGAGEIDLVAIARDADQREVAGAAADIADQHDLAVEEQLARAREVVGDPGIERRGGFFEQGEARQAGIVRGLHGEFARFFVERRGDGEDDVLLGERAEAAWIVDPRLRASRRGIARRLRRATARVRLRPHPTAGFSPCDRHRHSRARISRCAPGAWARSRPARARMCRRAGLLRETETTAACGAARCDSGATSCGISKMWMGGKLVSSASAGSIQASAELVVPRSMPTFIRATASRAR